MQIKIFLVTIIMLIITSCTNTTGLVTHDDKVHKRTTPNDVDTTKPIVAPPKVIIKTVKQVETKTVVVNKSKVIELPPLPDPEKWNGMNDQERIATLLQILGKITIIIKANNEQALIVK